MRLTPSNLATTILSLFFIACHSNSQPVSARTNNGKFHEIPIKFSPVALVYDTLSPQNRNIITQLDDYYRKQVRAGFNGSVLVGFNGKIIYERYFGYSNKERRVPLAQGAPCQLASVSKTFTGAAILYL
ncbi:MAG: serine hydrolase, partial [Chitinophagales bacterium]